MNTSSYKFIVFTCVILLSGQLRGCTADPITSTINNTITATITETNTATAIKTETITLTLQNRQPVEIVSVEALSELINPGGPVVGITLKNISNDNIVSLNAILKLSMEFSFEFNISSENPLLPNNTIYAERILINGGFADDIYYPLEISGTFQDGSIFSHTEQVKIT